MEDKLLNQQEINMIKSIANDQFLNNEEKIKIVATIYETKINKLIKGDILLNILLYYLIMQQFKNKTNRSYFLDFKTLYEVTRTEFLLIEKKHKKFWDIISESKYICLGYDGLKIKYWIEEKKLYFDEYYYFDSILKFIEEHIEGGEYNEKII